MDVKNAFTGRFGGEELVEWRRLADVLLPCTWIRFAVTYGGGILDFAFIAEYCG